MLKQDEEANRALLCEEGIRQWSSVHFVVFAVLAHSGKGRKCMDFSYQNLRRRINGDLMC